MYVSQDYEELFKILNAYRIKYLVVGAYAVMYYTQPRYTKDIDVWIIPELNAPHKIHEALREFGAPLKGIKRGDFADKHMILQIGVAPVRIDILMNVPGISYQAAWLNRKKAQYGQSQIYLLDKQNLIAAKKHAGRPQDKIDLDKLREN